MYVDIYDMMKAKLPNHVECYKESTLYVKKNHSGRANVSGCLVALTHVTMCVGTMHIFNNCFYIQQLLLIKS